MASHTRINSIDLLRGVVMIIMALDHTRDFFHAQANIQDPLDLQTTTPVLFLTRWITHFCAPVFVFLSGCSAYLQGLRKTKKELSRFLLTRGLWLIIAEVLMVTLGITFNIDYSYIILQVIWAIGISMVILGILVWLPYTVIFALGLIIVLGHNSLDQWQAERQGNIPFWFSLLHSPGVFPIGGGAALAVFYPFLPWTGAMMLGYCFGRLYKEDVVNRKRKIIILGTALIALFVILRWMNIYGDPLPWAKQKNTVYTIFSFINTQKYPPSLLYFCLTIGPALVVLGLIGNLRNKVIEIITVYGRVPFFYYIIHFYLIHSVSAIFFFLRGHSYEEGARGIPNFPLKFLVPGEGYSLGVVYLVWIGVVLTLYPLCKWFSNYKSTHKNWWLSYL